MGKAYDVVIVGAGPAGLFAAFELCGKFDGILVVDKGKDVGERHCPMNSALNCLNCKNCDIMCGLGGAGTFLSLIHI